MLIDLHVHSHHTRGCTLAPRDVLRRAKEVGLDGVAFTDLNTLDGVEEIRAAGREEGILALAGVEIATDRGHYLCFFPDPAKVPPPPQLFGSATPWPVREVLQRVRDLGGVAVAAHPYDKSIERPSGDFIFTLDGLSAIEGLNARRSAAANDLAVEAADHMNLPCVAGLRRARVAGPDRRGGDALPGRRDDRGGRGGPDQRRDGLLGGHRRRAGARASATTPARLPGTGTSAASGRGGERRRRAPRRGPASNAERPRRARMALRSLTALPPPHQPILLEVGRAARRRASSSPRCRPADRCAASRAGPTAISTARALIPSTSSFRRIASCWSSGSALSSAVGSSATRSRSRSVLTSSSRTASWGRTMTSGARLAAPPRRSPTGGSGASSRSASR